MFSTTALVSLAPIGRRVTQSAVGAFLRGGPGMSQLGCGDPGLGDLGILPLIAAAIPAAASAGSSYFAAGAAADAAKAQAAAMEAAAIAPFRYEYKTAKKAIAAQRFETAVRAVSGQTVRVTKDLSGALIAGGIAVAVVIGVVLVMKGT